MVPTLVCHTFCLTLLLAGVPAPKHLEEAQKLFKSLTPEHTSYEHGPPNVKWKGVNGAKISVCHTDCSGFLDELITHSYPQYNENAMRKWFGVKKRPLARHYHDTIQAQKGFTRIDRISDVQPGDIIATKYKPGKTADNSTGHVMLVVAAPKKHAVSGEIVAGTTQWAVAIMDETRSGHGSTDSRYKGKEEGKFAYQAGLGTGHFRIYTHKDGTIEGYSWSLADASKHYDVQEVPLVFGRIDPKYAP